MFLAVLRSVLLVNLQKVGQRSIFGAYFKRKMDNFEKN